MSNNINHKKIHLIELISLEELKMTQNSKGINSAELDQLVEELNIEESI